MAQDELDYMSTISELKLEVFQLTERVALLEKGLPLQQPKMD